MPRESKLTRDDRLELAVVATDKIMSYVSDMDLASYQGSSLHQDAVSLQIMQIAELLKPLDDSDSSLRYDIPESGRIIGMRNVIAHQYYTINEAVVWNAATEYVPALRLRLMDMLGWTDERE